MHPLRQRKRSADPDGLARTLDDVAAPQLATTPCLHLTVDQYLAGGKHGLGIRAGVDQPGELQQLTEPDAVLGDDHVTHAVIVSAAVVAPRRRPPHVVAAGIETAGWS